MEPPIVVLGIIPDCEFEVFISLEDIREVVCEALKVRFTQLHNFFEPLIAEVAKLTTLTSGIDIQVVCKAMMSIRFMDAVQGVVNGLDSLSNIRIIIVSLFLYCKQKLTYFSLSLSLIQSAMLAANIDQHKFFSEGILLDRDHIKRVLRSINRFIPDKILSLWLEKNQPFLSHLKVIAPDEFLFLVANTRDRAEAISELPYGQRTLVRDAGNKTFFLDETVKFSTAPDKWLQRHADIVLDYDRLVYIGAKAPPKTKLMMQKSEKVAVANKAKEELDEFKQALRNPKLIGEIRQALAESQHQLNTARLSGRLAYEEKHLPESKPPSAPTTQFNFWKTNVGKRPMSAASQPYRSNLSRVQSDRSLARNLLQAKKYDMYLPPDLLFGSEAKRSRPKSAVHWGSMDSTARARPLSGVSHFTSQTKATALSRISSAGALSSTGFVLGSSRPVTAGTRLETGMDTPVCSDPFHVMSLREATILSAREARSPRKPSLPVETPRVSRKKERWRV